jgi:hypothetical protein
MKIALCLSGQPRYLEEGFYFIQKYLLSKYKIDVFIHTWWDEDDINKNFKFTNIKRNGTYDPESLKKIEEFYSPKKMMVEPQIIFESFEEVNYGGLHPISVPSSFYSLMKSNDLKKEYEKNNKFKYDVVIRCRFDIVINNFGLDLEKLNLDKIYVGGEIHYGGQQNVPNDQFAISSSENMDYYSSVFEMISKYYKEGFRTFVGEQLLKHHLITIGLKEVYFCNNNELLTNAWWQFSMNDCNSWNRTDNREIEDVNLFKRNLSFIHDSNSDT